MTPSHAVVLSDVHIGNNAPTVWYQSSVHEPYLVAALDWVAQNADTVSELILLGDLVDVWTYPPQTQPPSIADIIAANPNVLGPDGALARAIKVVPTTTLLLGNHDGQLTEADINTLQESIGQFTFGDPVHLVRGPNSGLTTAFSHGHLWTMFNAPDDRSPWNTMPVGHFVTRAFSYMMANKLQPGQTVADLANMGYPDGFDIWQFLRSLGPNMSPDLASILLDYISTASGMPEDMPVVMPDGSQSSITEAKQIYADLFTRWVAEEGGSVQNAARAALADGSGEYLAWFAQRLGIQESADLVVMGHTHTPVGGLSTSPTNYYNSGFECASVPDNPPKLFSFALVDLDAAAAQIMQVSGGDYSIQLAPVPPMSSVVLSPAMDFSCYVRILNESSQPLTRTALDAAQGYWVVEPPAEIPPGGRADAWLQDYTGPHGSEGSFTYSNGSTSLPFAVSCPTTIWPNTISGANGNFVAKSASGDWLPTGQIPRYGHPLQVKFTVAGGQA